MSNKIKEKGKKKSKGGGLRSWLQTPPSPTPSPPSLPHLPIPETVTLETSASERERRAGDGDERRWWRLERAGDVVG